jgi:hypothetical protein
MVINVEELQSILHKHFPELEKGTAWDMTRILVEIQAFRVTGEQLDSHCAAFKDLVDSSQFRLVKDLFNTHLLEKPGQIGALRIILQMAVPGYIESQPMPRLLKEWWQSERERINRIH